VARSIFIERCANVLGGTHPINSDERSDKEEEFKSTDKYIVDLMSSQIGDIPVPYAHLLSYGQTILEAFRKFLHPDQ
jgi:hypothetical protein